MTKKKDSKVDQDNLSELEEVQDNIEQPEEKSDLEEEVEPSPEEKISSLEDQMMSCLLYTSPSPRDEL